MACHFKCEAEIKKNPSKFKRIIRKSDYDSGWGFCTTCEFGTKTDSIICSCCGTKFRRRVINPNGFYTKMKPEEKLSYKISLRKCLKCSSPDTYTHKKGYKSWYKTNGGHLCVRCYMNMKYNEEKRNVIICQK